MGQFRGELLRIEQFRFEYLHRVQWGSHRSADLSAHEHGHRVKSRISLRRRINPQELSWFTLFNPCFFQELTRQRLPERFAPLDRSAWQGPHPCVSSADQKDLPVVGTSHRTDSYHWPPEDVSERLLGYFHQAGGYVHHTLRMPNVKGSG